MKAAHRHEVSAPEVSPPDPATPGSLPLRLLALAAVTAVAAVAAVVIFRLPAILDAGGLVVFAGGRMDRAWPGRVA